MPPAKRTRQSRLDFTPAKKRKLQLSESDDDPLLPTPKKTLQSKPVTSGKREVKKGMFGSSDIEKRLLSDSSSDAAPPQRQKNTRGNRNTKRVKIESEEDEDEDDITASTSKRTRSRTKRKVPQTSIVDEVDSVIDRPTHPKTIALDSESSEEMPDTTPPPRRGRKILNRHKRAGSFKVSEESEDEVAPSSHRRRQKDDTGSDMDRSRREKEELEEDLDFLQSSPPPDKGRLRSTSSKPLNERQRALDALRRKRATASSTGEPSSSATPSRKRAIVLSESDSDELEMIKEELEEDEQTEGSDEIDEGSDDSVTRPHKRQTNRFDMFQEDEEDVEFIDDNPDDLLGAPAELTSLPLQFSSLSRAKPRELFKYAVEWMVQKKINPAFASDDEIYELTFRKLNDEVKALANSKFSSSAWTPDFTRALRARPEATIDEIGAHIRAISSPHCEACNRTTHPATFNICFEGKPYHAATLEPLVDSDDSDSDSDVSSDSGVSTNSEDSSDRSREKKVYDSTGELLPPESKVFTVGSTCKANAQMAHTLHHWRHHLNQWIVAWLNGKGYLKPKKLAKRDNWSVEKRRKYADKIVDKMEKAGEVQNLYKLYKDQLSSAVDARHDYKRGWGRR